MDLDTCVICKRVTPDPLLWPPDAKTRIVACEGCFIELLLLSEELSSRTRSLLSPSSPEVTLGREAKTSVQEPEPASRRPATKNRRSTTRWPYERSAKMSWLVHGSPVSATVQLVDGSEQGLGIRSPKAVDKGRAVRIKLADATALQGDVCHCRAVRGVFRLGVLLRNVRLLPSA